MSKAFDDLKAYLGAPPLLSKPKVGERLFLYLADSPLAVGSVLVREEDRVQKPVYYISRALQNAEARYTLLEKFIFAVVVSARKLRPYFQAHSITVLTDQPMRTLLHRPDISGRMAKWALELFEFDLTFSPRPSIKAQVLADFVIECTVPLGEPEEKGLALEDPEDQ